MSELMVDIECRDRLSHIITPSCQSRHCTGRSGTQTNASFEMDLVVLLSDPSLPPSLEKQDSCRGVCVCVCGGE